MRGNGNVLASMMEKSNNSILQLDVTFTESVHP